MNINEFAIDKEEAKKHWSEYVQACKDNPKDKFLHDMKNVYNQVKQGRKLIDVIKVMRRGGLTMDGLPRLAICSADKKYVYCRYYNSGRVIFAGREMDWWDSTVYKNDVLFDQVFPELPDGLKSDSSRNYITLQCPVPVVPAGIRPKGKLDKYHILWEVDKWVKKVPPKDPYLLRRITGNIFVVLSGWELTELERSVMAGRLV